MYGVFLFTLDATTLPAPFLSKIRNAFDFVFRLECFFDSKEFEDFDGFFKILKTP